MLPFLLMGVVLPALRASGSDIGRWETLEAIHFIENPRDSTRPGPYGELGPYQFKESTWRMHTKVSFSRAIDRSDADRVAVRHYEWLRRQLERRGVEASAYNIAVAWNAGVDAAVRGSFSHATRDYARRVSNLAEDLHNRVSAQAGG